MNRLIIKSVETLRSVQLEVPCNVLFHSWKKCEVFERSVKHCIVTSLVVKSGAAISGLQHLIVFIQNTVEEFVPPW